MKISVNSLQISWILHNLLRITKDSSKKWRTRWNGNDPKTSIFLRMARIRNKWRKTKLRSSKYTSTRNVFKVKTLLKSAKCLLNGTPTIWRICSFTISISHKSTQNLTKSRTKLSLILFSSTESPNYGEIWDPFWDSISACKILWVWRR